MIHEKSSQPVKTARQILESGTMISSHEKGDRIISIYYYQNSFDEIVFNTRTNKIEAIKAAINPAELNIFFEECSIDELLK